MPAAAGPAEHHVPAGHVGHLLQQSISHQEIYQGKLPHPDHLERYEHLYPGMANRIMVMAEKDQSNAQELRLAQIEVQNTAMSYLRGDNRMKQLLAFSSLVVCMGSSLAFALLGMPDVAKVVATTTVLGVIGAYLGMNIIGQIKGKAPNGDSD